MGNGNLLRVTKMGLFMLKQKDVAILMALISLKKNYTQQMISLKVGISVSTVNEGLKRLNIAKLVGKTEDKYIPMISNCVEFLTYSVKYFCDTYTILDQENIGDFVNSYYA